MDSSQSGSRKRAKTGTESDISSKTRKSSAYDAGFEQHLVDHGIYPDEYDHGDGSVCPDNWEEINERLAQPRSSLSPSRFPREAFVNFKKTNIQALTENTAMSKAFPIIAGTADIPSQENLYFGNLRDLTDGSITKAKPDFYDGSRPADLHKDIREELGAYIVPSTNTAAPCLPNFFTEGKGPNGNPAVCKRQALYDGAVGARGVHELRSYVDPETLHDSKAYTITSTYHNGTLRLYTTHSTPSTNPNRDYEFRMTQLRGWDMTGNPDTFRQGAGALRNARDWAKEKREEIITAANGKVPDTESATGASATPLMLTRSTGHGRAASNYQAATVVNAGDAVRMLQSKLADEHTPRRASVLKAWLVKQDKEHDTRPGMLSDSEAVLEAVKPPGPTTITPSSSGEHGTGGSRNVEQLLPVYSGHLRSSPPPLSSSGPDDDNPHPPGAPANTLPSHSELTSSKAGEHSHGPTCSEAEEMRAATIPMEREPQLTGHNASATGQTPPRSASPVRYSRLIPLSILSNIKELIEVSAIKIKRGHALIDESPEERKSSKIKELEVSPAAYTTNIPLNRSSLQAKRARLDREIRMEKLMVCSSISLPRMFRTNANGAG